MLVILILHLFVGRRCWFFRHRTIICKTAMKTPKTHGLLEKTWYSLKDENIAKQNPNFGLS